MVVEGPQVLLAEREGLITFDVNMYIFYPWFGTPPFSRIPSRRNSGIALDKDPGDLLYHVIHNERSALSSSEMTRTA